MSPQKNIVVAELARLNLRLNEPLSRHTTFRIGGPVDYFIEPADLYQLKKTLSFCRKEKLAFMVIGSGSNLLVNDAGVKGIVIKLNSPYFKKVNVKGLSVTAGAGVKLGRLVQVAAKSGLGGLEFLAGIPGTVGGALIMNAGVKGRDSGSRKEISRFIKEIKALDGKGKIVKLKKNEMRFSYRNSNLGKYIILGARFYLRREPSEAIEKRVKEYLDYKKQTQDLTFPSAGCIFKNPAGHSAGYLLDKCGLKGKRIGGAKVSERHANFIVNEDGAKAADVLSLVELARKKVKARFGIKLSPEIKFL
ncbi:MAG: UDP-N-acetylmuramate dehydrogenase [Candidatus Omnitrophica bacterium]|nr:UDP-N-acetylmuramate dehydrogenase [Candidatus Omnitrophota bacterium]